MKPAMQPSSRKGSERVPTSIRFPRVLYKQLKRWLVDQEDSISMNAFTVAAVQEKLDRESAAVSS
jgi:hypothetical protein